MIKLSDYVFDFIAGQGVRHVFLLPGGGCMHLVDSLGRNNRLEYVAMLHEQAAAIAADGYSQMTGNLGVALVTTGPGGTNALTGVAASWLDSIPVLVISGQVKRSDSMAGRGVRQMGFQEIDIVSMARPITKYAVTVTEPDSVRYHLEKAVHLAKNGRPGPVWLDIPLDVQAAMIDQAALMGFSPEPPSPADLTAPVRQAIDWLGQAERPVILAGNGVRLAGGLEPFLQVIDRLQIPVLTTWKAADFLPDDHPLYAGRPGAVARRGANFTQQNADWLLTIGARLDFGQTAYSHANFARAAHKIVVDIDRAELDKIQPAPALAVQADAGDFLREFTRQPANFSPRDKWADWLAQSKAWQARYPVVLPEYRQQTDYVNDYVLIDVLSDEMTADDLLAPGSSGACSERVMQAFRVKAGQRVFNSQGLGAMGFGLSAAIGGAVAGGGRRIVTIEGDGGFVMNVQELETVRRLGLPIKFFVLNNQGYASIRFSQERYFEGRYVAATAGSGLTLPDWQKIAAAFGLPYLRLDNHSSLRRKVSQALAADGPFLCEVMVAPDQPTMPRVSSRQRADGSMVSMPMEDLWPFLERDEFERNMVIPVLEGD